MPTRRELLTSTSIALVGAALAPRWLRAQEPAASPGAKFETLRRGVGFATLGGGTVGWWIGRDGAVVVDSQVPDAAPAVLAGLRERAPRLDVLVNTHHHWDHTGGNGVFRPVVGSILAHANVPGLQQDAAAQRDLGPQTFADTTFTQGWRRDCGDEQISARFFGAAHTGGDIGVAFERAEIVHLGDLVFNRLYPVIDRPGGARLDHWIVVLEQVLATWGDALYIFGHGREGWPVTGAKADVLVQRDYLTALLERAREGLAAGKSVDQIATEVTELAGFPDHRGRGGRTTLEANLRAACAELRNEPVDP